MALIVYDLLQKEPLSRSLRGRPFEHEEFMEILFPDVIGSGGAPKRITKPRRKGPDALPGSDEIDTPGTAILDLLTDPNQSYQQPTPQSTHQTRANAAPPAPMTAPTTAAAATQRPTSTILPPRTSIASTSALTPPEENAPTSRKRFLPSDTSGGTVTHGDKRRRTANAHANNNNNSISTSAATSATNNTHVDSTHAAQSRNNSMADSSVTATMSRQTIEDSILALAEAVRSRPTQRGWPEQAMEMFFREFADEDMELQIKIAEKALTDVNKAMMFCLMPTQVRMHWVKRLREVHNRVA